MSNWRCICCGWEDIDEQFLTALNPFDSMHKVVGCPDCKQIWEFEQVCDEPGCVRTATCGTLTPTGYRRVCGEHYNMPIGLTHTARKTH